MSLDTFLFKLQLDIEYIVLGTACKVIDAVDYLKESSAEASRESEERERKRDKPTAIELAEFWTTHSYDFELTLDINSYGKFKKDFFLRNTYVLYKSNSEVTLKIHRLPTTFKNLAEFLIELKNNSVKVIKYRVPNYWTYEPYNLNEKFSKMSYWDMKL